MIITLHIYLYFEYGFSFYQRERERENVFSCSNVGIGLSSASLCFLAIMTAVLFDYRANYLLTSIKRHTSLVFRFHRCLFNKWHYHTFHNSITETYLLGNSIPLIEIKQRRGNGEDYLMVLK